jgi:hypothetical protein
MTYLTVDPVPGASVIARPATRALQRRRLPSWARIFLSGLALWWASVLVTFATGSTDLVPTIILLGSFLVPVTFVVYESGRTDAIVTAGSPAASAVRFAPAGPWPAPAVAEWRSWAR